ncbi:hypothetical protein DY000_02019231 [Brassica cretica]|uniref:Ribosomal protein L2 C-terminal domain-containing protein n=1 Tax=Brassica cretica TaxID=69181 RepID=A0ABQ7DBZ2_BRACR|nr:hypothetical protein DY000_02019231 [Brassica cretica]
MVSISLPKKPYRSLAAAVPPTAVGGRTRYGLAQVGKLSSRKSNGVVHETGG